MLPDRVSNPGPLTYESGALPIAQRGPALLPNQNRMSQYMPILALILECYKQSTNIFTKQKLYNIIILYKDRKI